MPDVSVIVVNWNTRDLLARCLETVLAQAGGLALELIVVDNASTDDSVTLVRARFPQAVLIANAENVGFARANNQGARAATGRYLLLLNSDAFPHAGALPALVALAEAQPRAGLIGAHLRNPDGSFQASHTPFPTLGREFLILSGLGRLAYGPAYPSRGPDEARGPQIVDYVEGACMLARPEAYTAVGGLDEGYFMYAEDVDLCFALRHAGWQVWYHPSARLTHVGSASSRTRRPEREGDLYVSRVRFFRKAYGPAAAGALKALILAFAALKTALHGGLRLVSGGQRGRPVVPFRALAAKLRDV